MSFIAPTAGQIIRATHVSQFVNWLTGQKKDSPSTVVATSSTQHVLTLQSEDTTNGHLFRLMDATGNAVFTSNRTGATWADPFAGWTSGPLAVTRDSLRVDLGGYGIGNEIQDQATGPNLQAIAGAVNVPAVQSAVSTLNGLIVGVGGWVRTAGGGHAVALYGQAKLTGNLTGASTQTALGLNV